MLRKIVTHWHKLFFFPGRFKARILAFKFVAATVSRCHLWRVRVMAPAGPLWLLGLNNIPPGLQRGQEAGGTASTSECFARLPSTLLFPSLQLSSKNICLLFLWHPPLTSVLASPWPILSIVVDVMTKNKQCEGVRLPFVWAGRSPRRCREEGYHPTNTAASSSHSQLLTGTWTPTSASVVDQMQSGVDRLALFPGF